MLRIVHPAPRGQGTDPPTRRKHRPAPSLFLTAEEGRHLRAAARNIARQRSGTMAALARELGLEASAFSRKRGGSPGLAVALWRLTGVSLDELLRGKLAAVPGGAP